MNVLEQDADRKAYDQGAIASAEGRKAEDNPYEFGSPGHKLWELGYPDAQKAAGAVSNCKNILI